MVGRGVLARHRDGHMNMPVVGPVAGRDHFAESISRRPVRTANSCG